LDRTEEAENAWKIFVESFPKEIMITTDFLGLSGIPNSKMG